MKDKIEEMNLSEMLFNRDERLLDYITNLQEENKKLKSKIDEVVNKQQFIEEKLNYKSRNEKAIKFIDKYCIDDEFYINLSYKEKAILEVKKILQGSDK